MPKVTLYEKGTGERVEREPVDARELLDTGRYSTAPVDGSASDLILIEGVTAGLVSKLQAAGVDDTGALLKADLDEISDLTDAERETLGAYVHAARVRDSLVPKPAALDAPRRKPGRPKKAAE